MTVTSLVAAVAYRAGKIIKNTTKWYIYFCIKVESIVRNRVTKLEFTQTKKG